MSFRRRGPKVFEIITLFVTVFPPLVFFLILLQRNEYIFSLLEENDYDNGTVRGRMMEDTEEDKTRGQTAGRREEAAAAARKQQEEKGDEASGATARQRGAVILGLKIAGSRLHLVFQGHAKATENWVFRGVELTESQWHTLVLVVTGQRATLSVDCNAPVDM